MNYIILGIVGLLSGICASLGIGGGFVLLIYLTAVLSTNQLQAQLINLIFFIPIGLISLIMHYKHKLIVTEAVLPSAISGSIGAVCGVLIATMLDTKLISKIFAVFILIVGVIQLKGKKEVENEK